MSLLDKSIELYLMVKSAKPMNDPMFMQIKDFIVNHFGHDGTRAIAVADDQPIVFTYKSNGTPGGRQMRAFEHPLNAAKRQPQPDAEPQTNIVDESTMALSTYERDYSELGATIAAMDFNHPDFRGHVARAAHLKTRINALSGNKSNVGKSAAAPKAKTNINQSPELAVKAKADAQKTAAANSGKQNSPAPFQTKTPDVAAGDATPGGTTQTTESVDVDVNIAKSMKAKALGELYPAESMQRYLTTNGVTMTGKESRTQLAALVLLHIKDKSE